MQTRKSPPAPTVHAGLSKLEISKGSTANRAYEMLRNEILNLNLAPGTDLDEASMITRLGISRTPIREAFVRLAADGLVMLSPNRGAQVAPISLAEFPRYVEALDLLQRAVLRLAAQRRTAADMERIADACAAFEKATVKGDALELTMANKAFHLAVGDASQNRYLRDQYARLLDQGMRMLRIPFAYEPVAGERASIHVHKIIDEHRAMVEAIRERDATRAESLGSDHAVLFRSRFLAYLEQNLSCDVRIEGVA